MRWKTGLLLAGLPWPALAAGEGGSAGWMLTGLFVPLGLYLALQLVGEHLPAAPQLRPRLVRLCWLVSAAGALLAGWHGGHMLHAAVLAAYPVLEADGMLSVVPQMVAVTAGLVSGLSLAALVFALGSGLLPRLFGGR